MFDFLHWPESASTMSGRIDFVFNVLNAVTVFFSIVVVVGIVYFAIKYRKGAKADRTNAPDEGLAVELAWTIIPGIICVFLFVLATWVYLETVRTPKGAMEIYVVGKQWMWKLQHPEGKWEMNELHIPVGRKVKLTMTSEDVIHSFFIPAFRIKQDVIPGRFTTMWFEPTKVGEYHLFCAEYCGTNHSKMGGRVVVQTPADYAKWLREGNLKGTMAERGEKLFRQLGCAGCHGPGSSVRAPMLNGLYGSAVPIQLPNNGGTKVVQADNRYILDAILLPEQEIAAGFKPIMPTFKDQLKQEEALELLEYIKSLSNANGGRNSSAAEPPAIGTPIPDNRPLANPRTPRPMNQPLASPSQPLEDSRALDTARR